MFIAQEFYKIINEFLFSIYNKYLNNILFISLKENPSKIIISCLNSEEGRYFAYICFWKVYEKYQYMEGYLIIDDDYFIKSW